MRFVPALLVIGIVAFTPRWVWAQPTSSFADLTQKIKVGDGVQVEDRSGTKVRGRVTALSAEQITIDSGGRQHRFPRETVGAVAMQRRYGRRGALIGAAAGAVAFIPFTQGEHGDADAPFLGALLGAGAGAITGALIPRNKIVYRAPHDGASLTIVPELSRYAIGGVVTIAW